MEFDVGSFVAIGFFAAFVGAIVWAEVHSRRRRRHAPQAPATPDGGSPPPAPRARPKRKA